MPSPPCLRVVALLTSLVCLPAVCFSMHSSAVLSCSSSISVGMFCLADAWQHYCRVRSVHFSAGVYCCINFIWACCEAIKICNDASIYHNTPRLALWLGRRPLRGFPWSRLHSYMVSMSRAAPFFFLCNSHLFLSTSYLTKFPYHICSNHSPNRTGLLCLHFCRCFNGQQLLPPLDAVLTKNIPFAFAQWGPV